MRTTLTLEDDVAAQLERLRKHHHASLKDLVNEALRRGLRDLAARPIMREPFRTQAFNAGKPLLPNIDNVAEVLALVEGEDHK